MTKRYRTLSEIHAESMSAPEYRAAYEVENDAEALRETLAA